MARTDDHLFFELEFADLETLRAAHDGCRAKGIARVPGVSVSIGERCELIFLCNGQPMMSLRGEATACEAQVLELRLDAPREVREVENLALLPPSEPLVIPTTTTTRPPPQTETQRAAPMAAIRNLGVAQQVKLARAGGQRERVALERAYGKTVWEALLSNPRITPPEVARIARKGALPKPLVAVIAENPSWVSSASVRRALLTNPRLPKPLATKVLRKTPKHELKLVPKQTAYPAPIRELARKLIKG